MILIIKRDRILFAYQIMFLEEAIALSFDEAIAL